MPELTLLLASQSPRRREHLTLLGLPFTVTSADVDESTRDGELPADLARRLSRAKAGAAAAELAVTPGVVIVACDTVVALGSAVLGKPVDDAEAASMLERLRGRTHEVLSAVTLLEPATGDCVTDVATTQVVMRDYSDAEIAEYVASCDPLDKAGAYAIQHAGFHPVRAFQGCYLNVVGLPLCHVTRCLRDWDFAPTVDVPACCQAHTHRVCDVFDSILADMR